MGNPTITRLGKTQLWYRKWYNDTSYKSTLKITYSFETLLNHYFNYGLFFHKNFFYHNYWYKNLLLSKNNYNFTNKHSTLYFRKYYYSHSTLTIEHTYFLRLKTPEYFPLKLYILKYNNWLIASIQWFKPLKSLKTNYINTTSFIRKFPLLYTNTSSCSNSFKKIRFKLLMFFIQKFSRNSQKNLNYRF